MEKKEFVPNAPNYKGDGVAVWISNDKNNNKYLTIKVLGNITLRAFKYEPKPKEEEVL